MSTVLAPQCVECANITQPASELGPNGGRLQCRSCGRWVGMEHHAGCPLAKAAPKSAPKPAPKPAPALMAAKEAPAEEAPIGVEAEEPPKPKRKRAPRKKRSS